MSMMQMYPEDEDLKRAQDSIDNRLRNYGQQLWVPTREEYLAMKEREEDRLRALAEGDTLIERSDLADATPKKEAPKKTTKKRSSTKSKVKNTSNSNNNSSATKSVRRRKK